MKKLYLLILLFICIFTTGCDSNETKVASNLSVFENVASLYNLNVSDNMESYSNSAYITGAKIAQNDNLTIEMVIYDTVENAVKVQENQIKNFKNSKSSGTVADKEKGKNFYQYSQVSNGYYMISSRIDNTLIFSKTLLVNKEIVEDIIDDLED